MSDNSAVTGGVLADGSYAFDNVSGVKYSRSKISIGADGFATDWSGRIVGSEIAAYVDSRSYVVTSVSASSSLTIATTAYGIGDTLGAGWSFTGAARVSGGGGLVTGAVLLDKGDVMVTANLWLSSGSITFGTDNVAPSVSDTDAEKLHGKIPLAFDDLGGCRLAVLDGMATPYLCDATTLYVYATTLTANAIFTAVTDLRLRLFLAPD